MTSRVIDTTRQHGVTSHEPEVLDVPQAPPVTLDEAMAAVAGWEREGMPLFGLHRIAQALRDEVVRLNAAQNAQGARTARKERLGATRVLHALKSRQARS